jgi:hypothetical protein
VLRVPVFSALQHHLLLLLQVGQQQWPDCWQTSWLLR